MAQEFFRIGLYSAGDGVEAQPSEPVLEEEVEVRRSLAKLESKPVSNLQVTEELEGFFEVFPLRITRQAHDLVLMLIWFHAEEKRD